VQPRNWKLRISDILECIAKTRRFTKGFTFADFQTDEKTIDSVLRNLEIIGEATRHVPADVRTRYPEIPWAEMLTMRNIVIHDYHGVNLRIIWQTVKEDLPPLVAPPKTYSSRELSRLQK
jgi:uncharacterized protein with HEPN domain